jgi:hypothetical protein
VIAMTIVKFPSDTPPPEVNVAMARDERFRNLEAEVDDLDRMGEIAVHFVGEWMQCESSSAPRAAELGFYAVQELRKRLTEFKTQYFALGRGCHCEAPAQVRKRNRQRIAAHARRLRQFASIC